VLEAGIAFWRQHVLMWPASALLTGNGVAFVLRVPGTDHGDWWSIRGWWIFAATAAVSLLSKYVIRLRREHIFNPSNIGLVLCFLALGRSRAEPLDFWWGPMSAWMIVALVIIVGGGLAILSRLHLLSIAVSFWIAFAAGIGALALSGHAMTASWHLGPITGAHFWSILVTSPEILVFLFFMITDPKTSPKTTRGRIGYAVAIGLLAALLIAPARTEYWSKVAVLGALAIVCLGRALWVRFAPAAPELALGRRRLALAGVLALALYGGGLFVAGMPARSTVSPRGFRYAGPLPPITILPSKGVDSKLDDLTAERIVRDLMADLSAAQRTRLSRVAVWLELGGQGGSAPVARLSPGDEMLELVLGKRGHYVIDRVRRRGSDSGGL
jgi:NQR2, RnfD, RnfE family